MSVDLWPKESIGKPTRVPAATFDQTFIQNFANPSPPPQNLAKYTSPPHPLLDRPTLGWQNNKITEKKAINFFFKYSEKLKLAGIKQDQTGLDRSARSTLDFRAKGLKALRSQGLQVSWSQGLKVSRSKGLKVPSSLGPMVQRSEGLKVSRSQGLKVSRFHGLKVSRSQGPKVPRSQSLKVSRS